MTTKEHLGTSPVFPKKGRLGHIKNTALALALASTTLGTPSCNSNNTNQKQPTTDFIEKKPNYSGIDAHKKTITDELDGIVICENSDKQIFLSDGNKKLTEDFDDIKGIGRFDGTIYFIGVNAGKPAIINEKGDTIFSGLDEIEEYTIRNGDIAVSGRKDGKTCLVYNNKTIDEGREYGIYTNDIYTKNGIYATATSYEKGSRYITTFVNGKKVGPDFSHEYLEDGAFNGNYSINDYGKGYIIISDNNNNPHQTRTLIYNGRIIGNNLDSLGRANTHSELVSYVKNGKKYVLFYDGKEYMVDKSPEFDSDDSEIFVNDGKKSYYISDGQLHEYEGKYKEFAKIGKTSDGRFYFIGINTEGENFVIDGKKIGSLEHITGVGTTMDGTIFIRGWETEYSDRGFPIRKTPVISLNGTVREDFNPNDSSQDNLLHFGD